MKFTYQYLEDQYRKVLDAGYCVTSCANAFRLLSEPSGIQAKTLINRIDVDFSPLKARRVADILLNLGVSGSFFFRLHAKEYNPFSFSTYAIIKELTSQGFEIGLHSEIVDAAAIWGEKPEEVLVRDLETLSSLAATEISGAASHGGQTGLNNQDFFKIYPPAEFGLLYEAYDPLLFDSGVYVSDSEWTRWKSYSKGQIQAGVRLAPADYAIMGEPIIYLLIHGDTYYDSHPYES